MPGVFGIGKYQYFGIGISFFFFFFWLGVQIVNQNVMLVVNQRLKSELILRTAIMGSNCSLRKVIFVEKYPEASAMKGTVHFPDLKKAMGNHPSREM